MVKIGERTGRTYRRYVKADREYEELKRKRDKTRYYRGDRTVTDEEFQKARAKYRKFDRKNFLEGPIAIKDEANQLRRDMRRADKIIKKHQGWVDGTVKSAAMDRKVLRQASSLFSKHVNVSEGSRGAGGGGPISKAEYDAIIKSVDDKVKKK